MQNKMIFYVMSFVFFVSFQCIGQVPTDSGFYIFSPITISQPGNYYLNNDLVGTITIAADNVMLDLNNKKITPSGGNGISVTGHAAVTIKNGIIQNATVATAGGILISTCSVVQITGVDFIGNTTGAYILTSTNVIVKQCNFTGQIAVATPESSIMAGALVIDNSNNVIVRDNELVKNINCFGILMHNSSHDNILENNVCNQNQSGVYLHNGSFNNKIVGNTCTENSVSNKTNSGTGIYLNSNCSKNIISDNTCFGNSATNSGSSGSSNNGGCGIYLLTGCSNNAISENTCTGNSSTTASGAGSTASQGGSGIYLLTGCSNNTIQGNTCTGNSATANFSTNTNQGGSGIYLYGDSNNTIQGNTCSGNRAIAGSVGSTSQGGSGIYLFGSSLNIIQENTCQDNSVVTGGGPGFDGGTGIYLNNISLKNTIWANVCTSNLATSTAGGSGIFINNNSDNNVISENVCSEHVFGPVDTGYGIRVQTVNCDINNILFNQCSLNTGVGISDAGTGTIIYNNSATSNTTNYSGGVTQQQLPGAAVVAGSNFKNI